MLRPVLPPWIQLSSGRPFDLDAPKPEQVRLCEIAHSLSNTQRWTGHALSPFSVADHTIMTVNIADVLSGGDLAVKRAAFAHDLHEAYTGDVSSPLKALIQARAPGLWASIVDPIQAAIEDALEIERDPEIDAVVRLADEMALAEERVHNLAPSDREWSWLPRRAWWIVGWRPLGDHARAAMMELAAALGVRDAARRELLTRGVARPPARRPVGPTGGA